MAANTTTAKTAQAATAEPTRCECSRYELEGGQTTGCKAETKRLFAPGHDAKLKSFLIRAGAAGELVTRVAEDGHRTSGQADSLAAKFTFGYMVKAGITRARDKAAEKAERAAARATRKAAPKTPKKVTAKVGRATFTGRMDGDHFVYEVKGKERRTLKFQAV
ncbi:hypothetical protein AB0D84_09000 [Streptomyces sp. NPDC048193]|uniref:hypothetical protein n=1 Tax=Streptomyces sp. NPDC048193 TaxID=3155630 RepID=UPI00344780E7